MNSSEASWAVIPLSSEYSTYKHNRYSQCGFIGPKETMQLKLSYKTFPQQSLMHTLAEDHKQLLAFSVMNIKTVQCITPDSGSEMKGGKSVQTPPPRLRLVQFFIFEILGDDLPRGRGGGVSYFPYILLNEIQTMFSQLEKRSARVLPADLCTDHAHYIKIHREETKTWRSKAGLFLTILYFRNSQIY